MYIIAVHYVHAYYINIYADFIPKVISLLCKLFIFYGIPFFVILKCVLDV